MIVDHPAKPKHFLTLYRPRGGGLATVHKRSTLNTIDLYQKATIRRRHDNLSRRFIHGISSPY